MKAPDLPPTSEGKGRGCNDEDLAGEGKRKEAVATCTWTLNVLFPGYDPQMKDIQDPGTSCFQSY